jgi:hypothetical protein
MKKITLQIIAIAFVFCLTGLAQASLINDQSGVDIEHHFPTFGTIDLGSGGGQGIQVTASGPDVPPEVEGMHFGVYDVDVEANSVTIDFLRDNRFGDLDVFDWSGLVISDLDFQPGYILLGVDVDTNMVGWDDETRLMFGDDYAGFNWQGLAVNANTNFTAIFDFGPNPIPIPATLLLFVSGIAGFTLIRRKITK